MDEKTTTDKPPQRGKNGRDHRKVLRPVQDLEAHVRSDWWRGIFKSLVLFGLHSLMFLINGRLFNFLGSRR